MNEVKIGLGFNDEVRFYIADTTNLVQKLHETFNTTGVCSAAIGRSASITAIMGLMLKSNQDVTTIIDADGPSGKIISVANSEGEIRALIENPNVESTYYENNKLNVASCVGSDGILSVIKNLNMKHPYNGQINLISGEIAQDYTYYFSESEQTPSALSAGVLVDFEGNIKSSGALVIQLLPDVSEQTIDSLESNFKALGDISNLILNNDLDYILKLVFEDNYKILDTKNLVYKCTCSRQKYIDSIRALPENEIVEIKSEEIIECVCHFCKTKYQLSSSDI